MKQSMHIFAGWGEVSFLIMFVHDRGGHAAKNANDCVDLSSSSEVI